jgi:hypothetical protein
MLAAGPIALLEALARALEGDERWERTAVELREENARPRAITRSGRRSLRRWPLSWRC